MKNIYEILHRLKERWPQYDLQFIPKNKANTITSFYADNKLLLHFNEQQILRDLEFFRDRDDFEEITLSLFEEKLREYHKKESKILKRGMGSRGLTIQQIKEACAATKSNTAAAAFLHISYATWKKYAKMYVNETDPDKRTYFETQYNPTGLGISTIHTNLAEKYGGYKLQDVIDGKIPSAYPSWKYKHKLLKLGLVKEECAICGFDERRASDYKTPLLVDYIDGDETNKKFENVRLLCYNCYFLNVNSIFFKKKG